MDFQVRFELLIHAIVMLTRLSKGIIMFLQSLPTEAWTDHEIEMLLSQAFVLCNTWANAQSHFS